MSRSQEALVLRQVAALRRAGTPHDVALRVSAEGLPAGSLKQRVQAALAALNAGGATGGGMGQVLATAGPVEALDLAAMSAEAELDAQAAVATSRRILMLFLMGLPLLVCGAAWASHLLGDASPAEFMQPSPVADLINAVARYAGAPLAALGVGIGHVLGARFAPGRPQLEAAIALLRDPNAARLPGLDACTRHYLALRLAAVPPDRAAQDVVEELVREAREQLASFRLVAPLLAAATILPVAVVATAPLVSGLLGPWGLVEP